MIKSQATIIKEIADAGKRMVAARDQAQAARVASELAEQTPSRPTINLVTPPASPLPQVKR